MEDMKKLIFLLGESVDNRFSKKTLRDFYMYYAFLDPPDIET